MTTDGPFASAAEQYRRKGWHPVPVDGKILAAKGVTGREGEDLSAAGVLDMALEHPGADVGLRMPVGVIGIDVDHYSKDGVDKTGGTTLELLEAKLGELPMTWRSTARGPDNPSGIRYYRLKPQWLELRGQMDIDGHGDIDVIQRHHRFALVEPSQHQQAGEYRWYFGGNRVDRDSMVEPARLPVLPQAWAEHFTHDADDTEAHDAVVVERQVAPPDQWHHNVVEEHSQLATALDTGTSRHDTMTGVVMRLARHERLGLAGATTALEDLGNRYVTAITDRNAQAEWDRSLEGARSRVASTSNREETIGSRLARSEAFGSLATAGSSIANNSAPEDSADDRHELILWSELGDLEEGQPLVDDLIDQGMICSMFGESGSSKTWGALYLAGAIAHEDVTEWIGFDVAVHPKVLYIAAEGVYTLPSRMQSFSGQYEIEANERLAFIPKPVSLVDDQAMEALATLVEEGGYGLVVWDTLARNIAPGDENSGQDVGKAISNLTELTRLPEKPTQLIIHHTGHQERERARGHSSFKAAIDIEFRFNILGQHEEGEVVTVTNTKQKFREKQPPFHFLRKTMPDGLVSILPWTRLDGGLIEEDEDETPQNGNGGESSRAYRRHGELKLQAMKEARAIVGRKEHHVPLTKPEMIVALGLPARPDRIWTELLEMELILKVDGRRFVVNEHHAQMTLDV